MAKGLADRAPGRRRSLGGRFSAPDKGGGAVLEKGESL